MDLMFAAQMAAAQYYANIAAAASSQQQLVTVTSGAQQVAPPPPSTYVLTAGPPPPPALSGQFLPRDDDERSNASSGRRDEKRRDRDRKRSRSRDRDRSSRRSRSRDRKRSRSRDRDRSKRSRSRDRYSRRSSRSRSRDRTKKRSRSRSRDRRERTPDSDEEAARNVPPNNTIMVRGLAQHITESDLSEDIRNCGLVAKDIRLIRKKETGASRGFAFIEFAKIQDSQAWMEAKQGILMFKDQYRAVMQYSLPRDGRQGDTPRVLHDWICANCGVQNFRRRDQCFKCGGPKTDIDAGEGADEVSPHPTTTVLLRGLDALSTEDSVLNCLIQLTNLPIKSIRIGRDGLTNTSRGICYVEMNTIVDSMFLHNQLLGEPPTIDDKLVSVSYYRPPVALSASMQPQASNTPVCTAAANAALAAAQWSHQGRQGIASPYSHEEIERMAEYSASLYAKTASEKAHYLEYYRNYYKNGGQDEHTDKTPKTSSTHSMKVASEKKANKVVVNGIEYTKYPTPDVSTYTYDEASGFYYDSTTQLYYDAKSQYYFNSKTNKYVYWDPEHSTFLPPPDETQQKGPKKDGVDKKDKVKTAKKIAKDMEKWAKTLNQKSKSSVTSVVQASQQSPQTAQHSVSIKSNVQPAAGPSTANSEDVAFSILQSSEDSNVNPQAPGLSKLTGYGSDSADEDVQFDEQLLTDWSKLACLLCKRQFPTREKLTKHNQISDLHKSNLESWKRENIAKQASKSARNLGGRYRDRAKERRQKYGLDSDEGPRPNKLKEKYLAAVEEAEFTQSEPKKLDSSNIGSKMLQKMGWKEGLGLGKTNQGRTTIIEADGRNSQAGLGSSKSSAKANPNESYKDSVKRTLFSRYHELNN